MTGEFTMVVLAMVKQAMADLGKTAEREDAVAFLTNSLWNGDPEGPDFRAMAPTFFEHETEIRERIRLMIAGEIELPEALDDEDGAMAYEDVLALLLSEAEGTSS